jgi:lycopene cyclase domain-containing protein
VRHLGYVAMLLFCVLGTLPLEPALGVGVYRRVRRLALTLLPVVPVFVVWDLYAVARGHWTFDRSQLIGLTLPGGLPVEEVAFFVVVPLAAVLTLEAVRAVRGWAVSDEVGADSFVEPRQVLKGSAAGQASAAGSPSAVNGPDADSDAAAGHDADGGPEPAQPSPRRPAR